MAGGARSAVLRQSLNASIRTIGYIFPFAVADSLVTTQSKAAKLKRAAAARAITLLRRALGATGCTTTPLSTTWIGDRRQKAVSGAGQCLNVAGRFGGIAERDAQPVDPGVQAWLKIDKSVRGPQPAAQVLPRDDGAEFSSSARSTWQGLPCKRIRTPCFRSSPDVRFSSKTPKRTIPAPSWSGGRCPGVGDTMPYSELSDARCHRAKAGGYVMLTRVPPAISLSTSVGGL